jgi:hypothetical protein
VLASLSSLLETALDDLDHLEDLQKLSVLHVCVEVQLALPLHSNVLGFVFGNYSFANSVRLTVSDSVSDYLQSQIVSNSVCA